MLAAGDALALTWAPVGDWLLLHAAELAGYLAALFTLGAHGMKRMIPLRCCGIVANLAFIAYGLLGDLYPPLVLQSLLLPLNAWRLMEMRRLTRQVKAAARGDLSYEWLKPFMSAERRRAGETIFRRGDASTALYVTVSGRWRLPEIDATFGAGQIVGEIGLVAPGNRRTLSFVCVEDGTLLGITYDQVRQLYFQNPRFGFHMLDLVGRRLFDDIARLERDLHRRPAPPPPT